MTFTAKAYELLSNSGVQTMIGIYVSLIILAKSDDIIDTFSRWKHALIKRKDTRKISS
ncbi:MAG: hypothetical protein UX35_C0017G0004 [Microgenomates group bacterium GW2011_GWA1_46_15]|nr:MAG: hypothetical protein UX00_C0006G0044 [Microgenomates group bacterium GW2011_GWB1_45_17]KKU22725.1 MAG: hypothetical protein UX35_C0017G0004 [Microgenomates group bacterium GW2011_GWA1_46_15]KKU23705.1 MAG: hypothetical protein UX36_C0003G0005 [Microgenomates group bacterium GW2011_GWC1_46_15]